MSSSRWTTRPPHTSHVQSWVGGIVTWYVAPQFSHTRRPAIRSSTISVGTSRLEHDVERVVGAEDGVELLRLRQRAREAVEDEPALEEVAREAFVDDLDDGVVGHELSGVHVALRLEPRRGAFGRGGAEEVTGGEVLDAVVVGEERGLRAFAGSLLAEQHEARALPRSSAQARNPS